MPGTWCERGTGLGPPHVWPHGLGRRLGAGVVLGHGVSNALAGGAARGFERAVLLAQDTSRLTAADE